MIKTSQIQRRRGTTSQHSSFVGADGELTVDINKNTVVVHDGVTAGGNPLLREDRANSTQQLGSYRNRVQNGNFDLWQRGPSVSLSASTSPQHKYAADRWGLAVQPHGGTSAACSVSRQEFTLGQTTVPGEPKYFSRITNTTAGTSLGTASYHGYFHNIEDIRSFSPNEKVTISFYARSSIADKIIAARTQFHDTSNANNARVSTFTLTSSWAKYSFTVTYPDLTDIGASLVADDLASRPTWLQIGFFFQQGSDAFLGNGTTLGWQGTGDIDIAQVQVESGTVATPFETRSFGEELLLCQRYYEKSYDINIAQGSASTLGVHQESPTPAGNHTTTHNVKYKVRKCKQPTVTTYDPVDGSLNVIRYSPDTKLPIANIIVNGEAGFVVFLTSTFAFNRTLSFHWTADSDVYYF